ncbi:hypothetical protein H4Q26_018259 [Puccinia striiformis f. sp. tritici PST-130]|nr:hypothetical protein H4Q26_018259 [Puccinia striiformis f. sp. tritici PST-130]
MAASILFHKMAVSILFHKMAVSIPFHEMAVSIPFHEMAVSIPFHEMAISIPSRHPALTERVPIDAADNDVDGSQDGLAGPGEPVPEPQLADIHINYLFHVVQASNNAPSNPRARKRRAGTSTATDDLPKTMKLEAKDNKIIITWPVNNFNLSQFKREVIDALRHNVNEWLAVHAQDLENNGHLTWQVAIKNGGVFAAVHNQVLLPANNIFEQFLNAAGGLHESKMKTCTLIQEDPKIVAQNEKAFKQLKAHHAPDNTESTPTQEPTARASAGAALHDIIRDIYAAHDPCERLSHLSEAPVCINPEDPNEYFVITCFKADAWARAIRRNPGEGPSNQQPPQSNQPAQARIAPSAPESVTETGISTESSLSQETRDQLINRYILQQAQLAPPLVPAYQPAFQGYQFGHPPSWYPQQPSQPPYFAHPTIPQHGSMPSAINPPFTPAFPGQAFPGQPYHQAFPNQQQPEASPAPSDHGAPIDDFIPFAQLGPNPTLVIDGLNQLGITHWTLLQHVNLEELISVNIPLAQARALMLAYKRYSQHLKKIAGASGSK